MGAWPTQQRLVPTDRRAQQRLNQSGFSLTNFYKHTNDPRDIRGRLEQLLLLALGLELNGL
jgi:hypothetical protein